MDAPELTFAFATGQHCCQAGYNHTDKDKYSAVALPKVPCSFLTQRRSQKDVFGESNGVCDGFGTCQCAPPFIGDDCSIKDCKHNCSHRGLCSVEFPVSRCLCGPGFYGEYCQFMTCLNNCKFMCVAFFDVAATGTWPNGVCNHTTGECKCRMMYSPYNNTREYHPWEGEDCSYLWAYCGACGLRPPAFLAVASFLAVSILLLPSGPPRGGPPPLPPLGSEEESSSSR